MCTTNPARKRGIKDLRGSLRFWGVNFNGIMIVFVGAQIFNWFIGTKSTTRATPTFTQPAKTLYVRYTIRVEKDPRTTCSSSEGHYFWQMTDILLFQRLGERLPHIIFLISSEHTVPNEPFSSPPIKGIYCSSWIKRSLSPFSCVWAISPLWLCLSCLRSVLLSRRVKVTSVWLIGRHPSAPRALRHAQTDRKIDWQSAAGYTDVQMNRETEVQTGRVLRLPHDEEGRRQISVVERADCDLFGQTVSERGRWRTADVTAC